MSRPLVILRPEPGWSSTVSAAQELGLTTAGRPLFEVEPVDWTLPQERYDAILAGSANAFRHGGDQLAELIRLPVYCVGRATADAAADAGFAIEHVGEGGLQAVLDTMPDNLRLLRLAGEERVSLAPSRGICIDERIVYRSSPRDLIASDIGQDGLIALHSGASARHFASEVDRLGLRRGELDLLALGPRIAECAGDGWRKIHTSPTPGDAALLAMAKALCQ